MEHVPPGPLRLFTALPMPESFRHSLSASQIAMRRAGFEGNYTREENFHLTLHFIGEHPRSDDIIQALGNIKSPPILLRLKGLFAFGGGRRGTLVCRELEADDNLQILYRAQAKILKGLGITVEKRPYKPHITLARKVVGRRPWSETAIALPEAPAATVINESILYVSHRLNGRLTYTPLARFPLE